MDLDAYTSLAPLGVWDGKKVSFSWHARKVPSAGTGRRINEVKMDDFANPVGTIDDALEAAIIELKSLQAAAKAFLQHGVRKVSLQAGFLRIELFLVMPENLSQELGEKFRFCIRKKYG